MYRGRPRRRQGSGRTRSRRPNSESAASQDSFRLRNCRSRCPMTRSRRCRCRRARSRWRTIGLVEWPERCRCRSRSPGGPGSIRYWGSCRCPVVRRFRCSRWRLRRWVSTARHGLPHPPRLPGSEGVQHDRRTPEPHRSAPARAPSAEPVNRSAPHVKMTASFTPRAR